MLAREGLVSWNRSLGGFEVAVGDAEGCAGSWLDAELTDPAPVWSSRTRGSRCSSCLGVVSKAAAPSGWLRDVREVRQLQGQCWPCRAGWFRESGLLLL